MVVFPPTEEEAEDEALDKALNLTKARVRESELERTHGALSTLSERGPGH